LKEQIKYLLGSLLILPIFPWLYYLAISTKNKVPELPNALNPGGTFGDQDKKFKLLFMGESTFAGVGVQDHKENVTGKTAQILHNLFTNNNKGQHHHPVHIT